MMTVDSLRIKATREKVAFHFFSDQDVFHYKLMCCNFLQRTELSPYCIYLTFASFSFNIAADRKLKASGIVDGYGLADGVCSSARDKSIS